MFDLSSTLRADRRARLCFDQAVGGADQPLRSSSFDSVTTAGGSGQHEKVCLLLVVRRASLGQLKYSYFPAPAGEWTMHCSARGKTIREREE